MCLKKLEKLNFLLRVRCRWLKNGFKYNHVWYDTRENAWYRKYVSIYLNMSQVYAASSDPSQRLTFQLMRYHLHYNLLFLSLDLVGPWLPWSQWSSCSVSCGGGQQIRSRVCSSPPCHGLSRQSKTCNTQVCLGRFQIVLHNPQTWDSLNFLCLKKKFTFCFDVLWFCEDVGCPPGRLYRECHHGEGCPFSCSQVSEKEGCYSDGCEEGCHCPHQTYQHRGHCIPVGVSANKSTTDNTLHKVCNKQNFTHTDSLKFMFQECPCLVDKEFLASLQSVSGTPVSALLSNNIFENAELNSGYTFVHDCSSWWAKKILYKKILWYAPSSLLTAHNQKAKADNGFYIFVYLCQSAKVLMNR